MEKITNLIAQVIIWVVGIVVIYMIILKILGHSPSYEVIIVGLVVLVAGKVYHHGFELGALKEFRKTVVDSFQRVKEDIGNLREDIKCLGKDIKEMNKTITKIENNLK